MEKRFLLFGLIFGLLAVVIGAFGAHILKQHLSFEQQSSFETGVKYQMYHALLLLILSKQPQLLSKLIFYLLVIGTIFFSGSIYLLNLREVLNWEFIRFLGPITPIGGSLLIVSWALLLYNLLNKAK